MPRAYRPMKAEGSRHNRSAETQPQDLEYAREISRRTRKETPCPVVAECPLSRPLPACGGESASGCSVLFRIGEGRFEPGELTDRLSLEPDHDDHGTIQPASIMPYEEYKQAIYDTRDLWVSGEDDDDH